MSIAAGFAGTIQFALNNYRPKPSLVEMISAEHALKIRRPADSICLQLPWGDVRNFLVPARNPSNPTYQFRPTLCIV